jgi:beta-N-acetylhexosaminidase
MANLTVEEKIGQLFMVAGFSATEKMNYGELITLAGKYHVGGVIFLKGQPYKQVQITNELQRIAKVPLMIAMDAEWGLAMRLDSSINYGYQMSAGAVQDDSLIYRMGRDIAQQCKRLGMHINFAPVVDVNNNPLNPVIHMRSFGENKYAVSRKALMYMQGMQDEHILAVAKHFPGHGNTDVDSHLDLPILKQSKKELDTLELYPFRYMFAQGVGGVMTAHLHIPVYDTARHTGASLSPYVTSILLRNSLKFRGITFSDALNMQGVAKFFAPGELELKALMAGNDVLLYSEDIPRAIKYIKAALDSGCIDMEFIDERVERILQLKKWVGLDKCTYIPLKNVTEDINKPSSLVLKKHLAEESVTLVRSDKTLVTQKFVPLTNTGDLRIACVALGTKVEPSFQQWVKMYCRADYFLAPMMSDESVFQRLRDTLRTYNVVILSLHNLSNKNTSTYGMSDRGVRFINDIIKSNNTILVSFGSPYALDRFPNALTVIDAYQDDIAYQQAAAQVLFGSLPSKGHLPVTVIPNKITINSGVTTKTVNRIKYVLPEEDKVSSKKLAKIDSIFNNAIKAGAMPGGQVAVVHNGNMIYNRSFGYSTYTSMNPVTNTDLYDLASVTKVAATTLMAMKMYEQGKLDVLAPLYTYLPDLKGTDKGMLQIKEIMAHQAGLQGWVPFYKRTIMADGSLDTVIYSQARDSVHTIRVAEGLYMLGNYKDTIYKLIDASALEGRGKYRYSDLGFIYMQRVIERTYHKSLDSLVDSLFYKPLGLATMTYKPRNRFGLEDIMPTEDDTAFRNQLVQGDVHDPAAAMLGGVAGHAGLFSNANDLAILLQMLLNGGTYAGKKYFEPVTIKLFTSRQYDDSRRGLGWDKPPKDTKTGSPASRYASQSTFGHTGFTGTTVWVDPEYKLIYVFLSNRVYPTAENTKLAHMNVRTDIHDVIYEAVLKP